MNSRVRRIQKRRNLSIDTSSTILVEAAVHDNAERIASPSGKKQAEGGVRKGNKCLENKHTAARTYDKASNFGSPLRMKSRAATARGSLLKKRERRRFYLP
jgi:hypothetical protein